MEELNNLFDDHLFDLDKVEEKTYADSFFDYCGEMCNRERLSPHLIVAIVFSII